MEEGYDYHSTFFYLWYELNKYKQWDCVGGFGVSSTPLSRESEVYKDEL